MSKAHKRTHRGLKFRHLAEGYRMLNSPLAATFHAAADHYTEADPPIDPPDHEPRAHQANQIEGPK
jgi:hypothetical protein